MRNFVLILNLVLMLNCCCFADIFTSHLKPNTDSVLDIGTSSLLWKYIYGDSFTDGTALWESSSLSGFISISGTTLTDGTFIVSGGVISAGTWQGDMIAHEFGGLEADISGYTDGLYGMASGATADIDTIAEIETAIGGSTNILTETEIDASSELLALMDDETGTGVLVFGTSPTFTTSVILSDGATLGQAAGPLITFDDTGDDLEISGCNVGIETTAPAHELHIVGDLIANKGTTISYSPSTTDIGAFNNATDSRILVGQSTAATGYGGMYWNYNATVANAFLSFGKGNNDQLIINNGNVGIEETNPQEDIHAADTVRADVAFNLNGTDGVSGTLVLDDGTTERITLVFTGGILTSRTVAASTALLIDWTD